MYELFAGEGGKLLWSTGKFRSAFEHVTEICLFPGESKMSGLEKFRIVRIYELSDVGVKEFCLTSHEQYHNSSQNL